MRKILIAAVVGLLIAVALFWWRERASGGDNKRQTRLPENRVEPESPPQPGVSLQIDAEHEVKTYAGTPLIFSVRFANTEAMNAAAENSANAYAIQVIRAAAAAGKIPQERADAKISVLNQQRQVRPLRLGDAVLSWEKFVHFAQRLPDGKVQPLAWPLKIASLPQTPTLTLDATATAQLDYLLDPAAAAQINPGEYEIVAAVDVPPGPNVAGDHWSGRVEAEPVKLSVAPRTSRLAPQEEENNDLQVAQYYQAAQDWARALEAAQRALAANPRSIPAQILVAEIEEAQGDRPTALQAYQAALAEFDRQYPDSYEAPRYLIRKIRDLSDQR